MTGHSHENSRAQRRRGNLEQARRDRGIRRRIRKGGVLAVLSGVVVAGMTGSVLAAPPAADKAPVPGGIQGGLYADTSRALEIPEGYTVRVWKFGESLRSVLPLGRALNSYEALSLSSFLCKFLTPDFR